MQAGVELGIKPHDAQTMLAQTLEGAAKLLLNNENAHPATEIEKVTTPEELPSRVSTRWSTTDLPRPLFTPSRPAYKNIIRGASGSLFHYKT